MACVYKHIRKDTDEVFYIGIGRDIARAYEKKGRNRWWYSITKKTEYSVKIIENNINWDEAKLKEVYWIKYYGRKDLNEGTLVNLTDGGDGVIKLSQKTKDIISKKAKNRFKNKKSHPMYGKKHTKESIEKNKKSQVGLHDGENNHNWRGYISKEILDNLLKSGLTFRLIMKELKISQRYLTKSIKYHYGDVDFNLLKLIKKIPKDLLISELAKMSQRKFCKKYNITNRTIHKLHNYYFNTNYKK